MESTAIATDDRAAYGYAEAAHYLRLPVGTLRGWIGTAGLVKLASDDGLSWNNLAELHVLQFIRKVHGISLQKVRLATEELSRRSGTEHPLLEPGFATDGIDLFVHDAIGPVNLSRGGQRAIREVVSLYLQRLGRDAAGRATHLFPFIAGARENDPRHVSINPGVSFGKPVIAGTGISTAVIAGRFAARDSIAELAVEYAVPPELIEDAIRWETPQKLAA